MKQEHLTKLLLNLNLNGTFVGKVSKLILLHLLKELSQTSSHYTNMNVMVFYALFSEEIDL
jgi:hypothetical protein